MYASTPGLSDAVHSLVLSGELSWPLLGVECNESEKNQRNTREKTLHETLNAKNGRIIHAYLTWSA